jgi:hypothetical protein
MTDATEQPQSTQAPPAVEQNPAPQTEPQATPEASKPAAEAKPPVQPGSKTVSYMQSGNKALDAALAILGRGGLEQDSFEMDQAREGNFGPLKAVLNHLKLEHGDAALQLMEAAYATHQAEQEKARKELVSDLHKIAGGKDGWEATQAFIEANATPDEAKELKEALETGGITARMAARYMATLYQQFGQGEQETKPNEPQAAQPQSHSPRATKAAGASKAGEFLGFDDYVKQYQALVTSGAGQNDPRVVAIQQARLRAIHAGH